MVQIAFVTRDEQFRDAWTLITELIRWDAEESRQLGFDPREVVAFFYPHDDAEVRQDNAPPGGALALATVDEVPAGCAAYRRIDARACELHNVYVRDEFRGRRIARQMIEQLIAAARSAGYGVMRLESASFMKEAHALYESLGFKRRGPYRDVPASYMPYTLFMELTLSD
jgi:ribosomal protein S18 acetylase RimI-like enzyme